MIMNGTRSSAIPHRRWKHQVRIDMEGHGGVRLSTGERMLEKDDPQVE
jgi:hypothetical protein